MGILIFIIVSWFFLGLISTFILLIYNLRGKEYDENYFDTDLIKNIIIVICLGYVSFAITLYILISNAMKQLEVNKRFTKFLFKIANIGLKKE